MTPIGRETARRLPEVPGVYRFADERGRVLYIGRATSLRRRVGSYWGDLGDRWHLAPMVARIAAVQAIWCDSEHEAAWLERNLMERRLPPWNRTAGGQETEVWVRLDRSPQSPGLSVVHVPGHSATASWFGPYLGGSRIRLAVAGLLRVRPLNYAGVRASGTAADLARQRGVSPADLGRLADSATAVLARNATAVAAVRRELTARRDAAGQAQAYEVAARIQEELAALEWMTSPQRVTEPAGADATVCGWSGGFLVRLSIRAGRMGEWRQLAATRDQASRQLAATPPEWREFARRNAELAAMLAGG
jgi:excinuclease ABC subunit C